MSDYNTKKLPLQQFLHRAKTFPYKAYLHQPVGSKWTTYTWGEIDSLARKVAAALQANGLQAGDKVAILAKNSVEWVVVDFAIAMVGMISVPIYSTAGSHTIEYVLEHSEAKLMFVGKLDSCAALKVANVNIPTVAFPYKALIDSYQSSHQWADFINVEPLINVYDQQEDDIYTLVYTSGSTGKPKGVVLSCLNMALATVSLRELYNDEDTAKGVSYLPMAHITERSVVTMTSLYVNSEIYFVESLDTFVQDLKHAKPTHFVSVPRLWAKFQTGILEKMPDSKLQLLLKIPFVGKRVAAKIREGLGLGECTQFSSGSAPISPSLLKWYAKLGMPICEGWGMSETAGAACANMPYNESHLGTIGLALDTIQLKLGDNDELLIKGPSIFKSYYKNPEATAEAFSDGWFKTGDKAKQNADGSWVITGRVKEQFKTAKGKYVAPVPIESLLGDNSIIEQCCVVGLGKPQPMALVVLNCMDTMSEEKISESLSVTIESVNKQLESHERLSHILVTQEPWSIENGLLTPTLKLKRPEIERHYQTLIDGSHRQPVVFENI